MELKLVPLEIPEGGNLILGQTHFIKTVEDIYEAIVNTVPQMKFGVAFNEASGPCLTRVDGNDDALKALAARMRPRWRRAHVRGGDARRVSDQCARAGFKDVPEVCGIFCATANPVEVVVAETRAGPRRAGRDRRVVSGRAWKARRMRRSGAGSCG